MKTHEIGSHPLKLANVCEGLVGVDKQSTVKPLGVAEYVTTNDVQLTTSPDKLKECSLGAFPELHRYRWNDCLSCGTLRSFRSCFAMV